MENRLKHRHDDDDDGDGDDDDDDEPHGVGTEFRKLNTGSTTEANHVNRVAMV